MWKWRCLTEKDVIWYELLNYRYWFLSSNLLWRAATILGSKDSIWWRDVGESIMSDWFRLNVSCVVGNGNNICFWNFKWCGNNSFGELYPNLFAKERRQNCLIADWMFNNSEGTSWWWEGCDVLLQSEEQDLLELKELLMGEITNTGYLSV
ncbi:unnamed protein product [Trifolium pratense]|uniref:Uncharacterized protein n=1 Tax=Trifolium pratense TaxID=57577 RepID=A0ACB0KC40_TRIPR|nr:unnamed protein product [Trifolium pratense]